MNKKNYMYVDLLFNMFATEDYLKSQIKEESYKSEEEYKTILRALININNFYNTLLHSEYLKNIHQAEQEQYTNMLLNTYRI